MKRIAKVLCFVLCLCMFGSCFGTESVCAASKNTITVYQGTYINSGYIKYLKSVRTVYSSNSKVVPAKFKWKASDFSKTSVENWSRTFLYAKGIGTATVKVTTKAGKTYRYTIRVIKKPKLKSMSLSYINGNVVKSLPNGKRLNLRKGSRVVIMSSYYPKYSRVNMGLYASGKTQKYYWDSLNNKLYIKGDTVGKTKVFFKDKNTGIIKYFYINVIN